MEIWFISILLLATLILLVTEKIPVDLTAIGIMVTLVISNILTPKEAVAGFAWVMAGATAVTWHAIGDTCPYCTDLDGRTVGIKMAFIPADDNYQPEGAEVPLRPHSNIRHAPAHKGCDCYTTAG